MISKPLKMLGLASLVGSVGLDRKLRKKKEVSLLQMPKSLI